MAYAFDSASALRPTDKHEWVAHLDERWSIDVVPNGGYSSSILVRALLEATGRPDPLSVTSHFYKPTVQGAAARVIAEIDRSGSRFSYATASLEQEGSGRLRTTGVFGDLESGSSVQIAPPPIAIPPPLECPERSADVQGFPLPLLNMVEVRISPTAPPADNDAATLAGWIRFRDGRPPDPLGLVLFADAFTPAVLAVNPRAGWVPTLELTTHIRRRPVPGWIRASIVTADLQNGRLIEDVLLWDEDDQLVAQARQLALLLN